jgi:hypothetical protein
LDAAVEGVLGLAVFGVPALVVAVVPVAKSSKPSP